MLAAFALLRSPVGKAGLLILAIGGFYLWSYHRGSEHERAKQAAAVQAEVTRQTTAIQTALKGAEARARLAEVASADAEAAVQKAIGAARAAGTSRQVCLTKEVTDALRAIK